MGPFEIAFPTFAAGNNFNLDPDRLYICGTACGVCGRCCAQEKDGFHLALVNPATLAGANRRGREPVDIIGSQ